MKDKFASFTFAVLVLVLGGATEEIVPRFFGVGLPVLLSAALFMASRRTTAVTILFALAAGGVEDALAHLPTFTSASFFLAAALLVHGTETSSVAMLLAYPAYQLWLNIWLVPGGGVFLRMLVAVPLGLLTVLATESLLARAERGAGVDE